MPCRRLKKNYPDKVLIASIMGMDEDSDWTLLAKEVTACGVDMIECNFSLSADDFGGDGVRRRGRSPELIDSFTRAVLPEELICLCWPR